jgi:hypothetical protein
LTRYFLDTTAQIERHAGAAAQREAVDSRLAGEQHATSTQVLREWKRIVDATAVDVLNLLREGVGDFRELFARLSQGWGREAGQRLRVLAMLAGQNPAVEISVLQARAELFLRSESAALFMSRINELRDGGQCGLAREVPKTQLRGKLFLTTQCKKTECACVQPAFLEGRKTDIAAAATALDAGGYAAYAKHIRTVMSKPDHTDRKGKACWGGNGLGGDLSIALDCAPEETLLTTDRSFEIMAPALGLSVDRISATPGP